MPTNQPEDIKPEFLKIARRLQACSRMNSGIAIVTMRMVIDESGTVRFWSSPKISLLEPKGQRDEILALLSGE